MSKPGATPVPARRDARWPEMPPRNTLVSMPSNPPPRARDRLRAANGPLIEDWDVALIGRQRIKEDAAYTRTENEAEDPLLVKGVRGALMFCVKYSEGALSRVPLEVVKQIEAILHDTTFKKSDLPPTTRFLPGAIDMRNFVGRLNVRLDENGVITSVEYG